VLAEHAANLSRLRENYESCVKAGEQVAGITEELASLSERETVLAQEVWEKGTEERELDRLRNRKFILERVLAKLEKQAHQAQASLQARLEDDIFACERLCGYWLAFISQRESAVLLESVEPGEAGKPELLSAATTIAIAGKNYCRALAELLEPAPVSYAWSRPLDPPISEKSQNSQRLFAHDALYAPPDRAETVRNLLAAASKQVSRWTALLGQLTPAVASGEFVCPSYLEPEKPRAGTDPSWNESLDLRSWREKYLSSVNRSWESLSEAQQQIVLDVESRDQSYLKELPEIAAGIVTEA
jgi:hypothetical protein